VQLGERHVDPALHLLPLVLEGGDLEPQPLRGTRRRRQRLGRLVDGRLHLDQARL
jgi:hypothetical protein